MYKAIFLNDNGKIFTFGDDNVFDIENLNGISVNLGTSQGYGQIGGTVQATSVNGVALNIKGAFKNDSIRTGKTNIKNVITAFSTGKLIFNDKYYIDVVVKNAPTFSPLKDNSKFMLKFFAPFPFFKTLDETVTVIGGVVGGFSFPVDYSNPHYFGIKSEALYQNVINAGDYKALFKVFFRASGDCSNIALTNLETLEKTTFANATLLQNETLTMYRTVDGKLKVELTKANGTIENKFSWLDEDSDLFELWQGDNIIKGEAITNPNNLTTEIVFNAVQGGVFEW